MTSPDGVTWTSRTSLTTTNFHAVTSMETPFPGTCQVQGSVIW
jgi:hypothetical protein